VRSLIFLKFVSDKFEERKQQPINEGQGDYVNMVEFYTMQNVLYLPEEGRWSYIQKQAKQDDIALKIDTIADNEHDVVGRAYEYFLSNFASTEGKGGASSTRQMQPRGSIGLAFKPRQIYLTTTM
jgi:type I restriction enzyme M protein